MHNRPKRITALDVLLLAIITGLLSITAYHLLTQLNYSWDWSSVPSYLFHYSETSKEWKAGQLTQGVLVTLRLSAWSIILALVIGIVMGVWRVSPSRLCRMISSTYVGVVRNIPPLVLIFIFYFFLGEQIMNMVGVTEFSYALEDKNALLLNVLFGPVEHLPAFLSGVITLSLFEGAYITEVVRAGIESIEKEQWEASAAQGFNRTKQLRYIILPQALSHSLPSLAGQFISTIKDSSIVSIISIQELTFAGQELMSATYKTFEIWTVLLALYFMMTFPCSIAVRAIERKMSGYKRY